MHDTVAILSPDMGLRIGIFSEKYGRPPELLNLLSRSPAFSMQRGLNSFSGRRAPDVHGLSFRPTAQIDRAGFKRKKGIWKCEEPARLALASVGRLPPSFCRGHDYDYSTPTLVMRRRDDEGTLFLDLTLDLSRTGRCDSRTIEFRASTSPLVFS